MLPINWKIRYWDNVEIDELLDLRARKCIIIPPWTLTEILPDANMYDLLPCHLNEGAKLDVMAIHSVDKRSIFW